MDQQEGSTISYTDIRALCGFLCKTGEHSDYECYLSRRKYMLSVRAILCVFFVEFEVLSACCWTNIVNTVLGSQGWFQKLLLLTITYLANLFFIIQSHNSCLQARADRLYRRHARQSLSQPRRTIYILRRRAVISWRANQFFRRFCGGASTTYTCQKQEWAHQCLVKLTIIIFCIPRHSTDYILFCVHNAEFGNTVFGIFVASDKYCGLVPKYFFWIMLNAVRMCFE